MCAVCVHTYEYRFPQRLEVVRSKARVTDDFGLPYVAWDPFGSSGWASSAQNCWALSSTSVCFIVKFIVNKYFSKELHLLVFVCGFLLFCFVAWLGARDLTTCSVIVDTEYLYAPIYYFLRHSFFWLLSDCQYIYIYIWNNT